jgi:hypothetical protein
LPRNVLELCSRQNTSSHTPQESLTCRSVFRHAADGFASPPNEAMLWIFIALKNPSYSTGFELANLGSNAKHDSHYSTESDEDIGLLLKSVAITVITGGGFNPQAVN